MSGPFNNLREHHEQHRERREERREARHERHEHGNRYDDRDDHDDYGSRHHGRRFEDDGPPRPQSYEYEFQGQGHGYAPPSGPPPSARGASGFTSQGDFDRGDFLSDADVDRMIASGEFDQRQGRDGRGYDSEYGYRAGGERGSGHDAPPGPRRGQGYGERANEYGGYDAPTGPPPGRGYQSQQPHEFGGASHAAGYGGGLGRQDQYGPQQAQGASQYGPSPGHGRGQGNAPSGGFTASRDGEERYGSGRSEPPNDRSEAHRRGEAASYYGQQGQDDRYAHLANIAQEHGDEDSEIYRQATHGLHEKIQSQRQSRQPRSDGEEDYKVHVDAHRKAYGGDEHGPMDADTIGAAAAMEAFKQTAAAAGSSNAPAGAFHAGKGSGGSSSKPERLVREDEVEEDTTASRAGGSGGLQDKLMALAMSHAGKLFDKKNAGSSASGRPQDKAQAMQSAAASAMGLFTQYQTKGKLESGDMSKVVGLAMQLL